ncbi:hypothetical protein TNCV_709751 [Trichonephila clavipes]|nr:hypothetical protein TNCV_709751 [Trichonephila clavipes]
MMSALWGRALSSIKTKVGPTVLAYNFTMGSRTSSQYQTAIAEPSLKKLRSVRYPNEIPAHTIMLPLRNAGCFGADCMFLVYVISLYTCHLAPEQIFTHQ